MEQMRSEMLQRDTQIHEMREAIRRQNAEIQLFSEAAAVSAEEEQLGLCIHPSDSVSNRNSPLGFDQPEQELPLQDRLEAAERETQRLREAAEAEKRKLEAVLRATDTELARLRAGGDAIAAAPPARRRRRRRRRREGGEAAAAAASPDRAFSAALRVPARVLRLRWGPPPPPRQGAGFVPAIPGRA